MKMKCTELVLTVATLMVLGSCPLNAQMEKRAFELYDMKSFNAAKPAVGEVAPDFELKTLAGETVKLSAFRGKPLVIIKGGYT